MTLSPKRIAVLFHEHDRFSHLSIVHHLAEVWREDGHHVEFLYGVDRFVPADLILVHVNLSVVPARYLAFAHRYPIVLNGDIRDIRKQTVSQGRLTPQSDWSGPVIIKSDLNYAGQPERRTRQLWIERHWRPARWVRGLVEKLTGDAHPFTSSNDYLVVERASEVPPRWFANRHVIVERFRPEVENKLYHCRIFQCLGDRWTCSRIASESPIVKAWNSVRMEAIEPDECVLSWREQLRLDYGKLDYVISEGEPVLLDVNKTTGATQYQDSETLRRSRRYRAEGLYSYFRP